MNNYKLLSLQFFAFFILASLIACSGDDNTIDTDNGSDPDLGFAGEIEWVKTFGGSNEDDALSVVQTTDGGYAVAGFTQSIDGDITDKTATDSDYWLLKLSKEGDIIWSKTYGGTNDDRAEKVIQTNDGGFVLVGYSRSSDEDVSINEGLQDYWIIKTDASGTMQWEKSFGFSGIDRAFSVVQTTDGGYFVTGFLDVTASGLEGNDRKNVDERHGVGEFWGIKLSADGEKQWRRYFGGTNNDRSYDAIQTPDEGFLMIGSSESVDVDISENKGIYDFWAVKVDAQGTMLWEKSYGGSEIDVGYAITATDDGNYIIVGDSRSNDKDVTNAKGNADLWAIKIDGTGNLIWQKALGGTEFDTGRCITATQAGSFVITGNSRSSNNDLDSNLGQSDIWTVIIDKDGNLKWKSSVGGSASEFGQGCIETSDKKIIVVGNSESTNNQIPENKGSRDFIVIKYK